jgi:hypothetical protein
MPLSRRNCRSFSAMRCRRTSSLPGDVRQALAKGRRHDAGAAADEIGATARGGLEGVVHGGESFAGEW